MLIESEFMFDAPREVVWVGAALNADVRIGELGARWAGLDPQLVLSDVDGWGATVLGLADPIAVPSST